MAHNLTDDVAAFVALNPSDSAAYMEAANDIVAHGPEGIQWVRTALLTEQADLRRRALLFALGAEPPREGWYLDVLLAEMSTGHSYSVAYALDALTLLRNAIVDAIAPLAEAESDLVRAAAVRFICDRRPQADYFIERALEDPSALVRSSTIDVIDDTVGESFNAALEVLTRDPDPQVRQQAAEVGARLTQNDG